jgi:succinate dehydrogenase/fumarate reductase flavoprotein subunit
MTLEKTVESDILVIGGGIAGCFAAIKAREQGLDVIMVDKGSAGYTGSTVGALLGYMVFNPEWGLDLDANIDAINRKGEYVNNREWTEIVFKDSLATYNDLVSWGVDFPNESPDDSPFINDYPPFGIVRIGAISTGPPARDYAVKSGVKIMNKIMITDLLKQDGQVVGAVGFQLTSLDLYIFKAKAIVLSTGFNSFTRGDGDGIAYRAGAEITTREFTYTWPGSGTFVGGLNRIAAQNVFPSYVNAKGETIDTNNTYELDLTMEFQVHAGKAPIYWNLDTATREDIEKMKMRQKNAYPKAQPPFDPGQGGKFPMSAADCHMLVASQTGGIWVTDTKCTTTLPGLYAAGECCGTRYIGGYHPAPGFGLTGSAVTGARAGKGAAEYALQAEKQTIDDEELKRLTRVLYAPVECKSGYNPRWVSQIVQSTMIPYFISYIKHAERLQAALTIIGFLRDHLVPRLIAKDGHELWLAHQAKNIVLNAEMALRCSLFRTESRGMHYREDYPMRDDANWLAWVKLKEVEDAMKLWKEPVPEKWWPDLSKPYEERYPKRFPGEKL